MMIKFALSALGLLAVIFLQSGCSVLGGASAPVAATATATVTPSPTPLVHASYTSTDGVYTVLYDPAWSTKPEINANTSGAVAISFDPRHDLFITLPLKVKSTLSAVGFLNSFLTGGKATNIKVASQTTSAQFPSGTWTVASGTATFAGVPSTIQAYNTVHANKTFVIFTVASTATAQEDQATHLQPMLQSLTFLK